jgi:hypothetical protein
MLAGAKFFPTTELEPNMTSKGKQKAMRGRLYDRLYMTTAERYCKMGTIPDTQRPIVAA